MIFEDSSRRKSVGGRDSALSSDYYMNDESDYDYRGYYKKSDFENLGYDKDK